MPRKQQKVLSRINYNSGQATPRPIKPNDECYTSMQDIINELAHWKDKFKGKNIICPCDWDIVDESDIYSIRIDFDEDEVHGHTNVVESVCYTLYDLIDDSTETITVDKEDIDEFLRDSLKCNFLRTFVENASDWEIKSVTASGYNPATDRGIKFETIDYSQYDVCVTNPPFSYYGHGRLLNVFMGKIDFIVLAPFLNRGNPSIGVPLMLKQCYLGYGRNLHPNFYNPTAKNKYKIKVVCSDWITSFDDAQRKLDKSRLKTGIRHETYKDEYTVMENMTMKDGTHPIRVNMYTTIPDDYYGWIYCPVGVLDVLSNDEFEWYITKAFGHFNNNPSVSPFAHKAHDEMTVATKHIEGFENMTQKERRRICKEKGEKGFCGIILRRKQLCN